MPGVLKVPNLTILHSHKPYKFLNSSATATATAPAIAPSATIAAVESTKSIRLKYFAGRYRTTTCARAAYLEITSQFLHSQKFGQRFHFYTSECDKIGKDSNNIIRTQMDATANGKVENNQYYEPEPPPQNYREKQLPPQPTKLLTLPTILTLGRVAAVPLLVSTFYVETWWGPTATTGIFIAAAITDWLDGYLARKMNLGTPFGAFLDPVADKLMVAATLILLCTRPFEAGIFGQAPWLLTVPAVAIIGREITMSAVREWAASQDRKLLEAVAVNNLGKWKTATQMSALTILLAARDGSLIGAGTLASSGVVLLYVSAWLALWSLVVYTRKISKVLLK